MPRIQIGSQVIEFPDSGDPSLWSQGIIDFAEAVAVRLDAIASPFDVAPHVQTLISDSNSGLDLNDAIFPTGAVRAFTLYYAIYRTNDVSTVVNQGEVSGVYDTLNATWTLTERFSGTRQASTGLPYQSFQMSGDQLQLNTTAIGGVYNSATSQICFSAKTELEVE